MIPCGYYVASFKRRNNRAYQMPKQPPRRNKRGDGNECIQWFHG